MSRHDWALHEAELSSGADAVPTFWCTDCGREYDGVAHSDGRCDRCYDLHEEFLTNARSEHDPRH